MMSDEKKSLAVRKHDGSDIPEHQTYFRVLPVILPHDTPLPFNLYRHNKEYETIELLSQAGGSIGAEELRRIAEQETLGNRLFVRGDHRLALADFQELMLDDLLQDESAPMELKCSVMQNQTRLLSLELMENPTGLNIAKQKTNVGNLVDFVTREPNAMRGLVALIYHDYYTYTHSVNVGLYGLWIVSEHFTHIGEDTLREIASGFFLHDIGKCRTPASIINKPGILDEHEWVEIRRHPMHGYSILKEQGSLSEEAAIITLQHHERIDGKGYPLGLRDDKVHPYARVCSIADAFDALTARRAHKSALSHYDALKIMRTEMKNQFDPSIFKTFVEQWAKNRDRPNI